MALVVSPIQSRHFHSIGIVWKISWIRILSADTENQMTHTQTGGGGRKSDRTSLIFCAVTEKPSMVAIAEMNNESAIFITT